MMVPGEGVEPSWTEVRGILSPVRLPVSPPRRHVLLPYLGKGVEMLAGSTTDLKPWVEDHRVVFRKDGYMGRSL